MNNEREALIQQLDYYAYRLRVESLRMTTQAGSGHPTSALSAADIVAALFFHVMKLDLMHPQDPDADRFILSKGHAIPVVYAAYRELGLISEAELLTYRAFDSELEGHPTPRFVYNDVATGSLGIGLSIGAGMALEAVRTGHHSYTYVLMGDSEIAEGSVWEASAIAAYYKLNHLIGIVDVNRLGQTTQTMEGYDLADYAAKWQAFGWHVIIVDGHTMADILDAFAAAHESQDKPVMIIAKTVKGYGLASIEGQEGYHGKALAADELTVHFEELKNRFPVAASIESKEVQLRKRPERAPREVIKLADVEIPFKADMMIATRKAFGIALAAYGKQLPQLFSLDAEVNNSTYADIFAHEFPERFVQCFIAEQNMVGMAVGFAARGALPVSSTFGAFFSRAFDQVRMAAIGRAPLRLVGSHAGVSIGQDGPSQMALEDIAMMRTLPDSIVLYPSDGVSAFRLVKCMLEYTEGISYLRTTRSATPVLYDIHETFAVGGCKVLKRSDKDVACVIAAGITVHEALAAYAELAQEGIQIAVIDAYSIKPLDSNTMRAIAKQSNGNVITVEDHYLQGGLGEAVGYALRNDNLTITSLAVTHLPRSGTPAALRSYEGIDAQAIVRAVRQLF